MKQFILQTDTLEVSLGAMLSQEVKGGEHLILYMSKKLLRMEVNYSTIEKEDLAVK